MTWKQKLMCARGAAVALMAVTYAAQADLTSYMSLSDGQSLYSDTFTNLTTVVGDAGTGLATIESYAWSDGTHWYYSYKILNNDASTEGVGGFGYNKCAPNSTDGIFNFSVTLTNAPGGVDDLDVTGYASSTGGGDSWGGTVNVNLIPEEFIEGAQWSVQLNGATGQGIAPTQWEYERVKGNWQWTLVDAGDTSSMDDPDQYFQFVSTYSPGLVDGSIYAGTTSSFDAAGGDVLGPVIPEPATGISFAFGALVILKGRRFIGFS